jgi:hypothetical protein
VKRGPARSSRADSVHPKLSPFFHSIFLGFCPHRHIYLCLFRSLFTSFLYFPATTTTSRTFSTYLSNSLHFCWRVLTSFILSTGSLLGTAHAILLLFPSYFHHFSYNIKASTTNAFCHRHPQLSTSSSDISSNKTTHD